MDRTRGKQNAARRGFTTIELMAVVAILTIALALAIPNLMQTRRNLLLMELDGTAREIFLSAQHELTDLKVSRGLGALLSGGGLSVETIPSLGGTFYSVHAQNLDAVFGAGSGIAGLLSTLPGESVIYLKPDTGDVTDVYYATPSLDDLAVKNLREELGAADDRERRAALRIGYYGGLSQPSPELGEGELPEGSDSLTLVNKEDLYFSLTYPAIGADAFDHPEKVLAEITLRDEQGKSLVLRADGTGLKLEDGEGAGEEGFKAVVYASVGTDGTYSLQIVLDSMVPERSFPELFPQLTAGDDISVSASLYYDGKALYRNAPAGTQNSLFAAKYPEHLTVGALLHRRGVEFSYVRHLSNLRHYRQDNTAAVQIADLDFALLEKLKNGTEGEDHQDLMLPRSEHRAGLPAFFAPIDVESVSGITVDGSLGGSPAFVLKNFKIEGGAGKPCGLFGSVSKPLTLQNLTLQDCTVTGSGATGALAGSINVSQSAPIEHCAVYQSAQNQGLVKGTGTGASAATGGLIGAAQGPISIKNSFAAVDVTAGNTAAGGLIGRTAQGNIEIKNCYASGAVTAVGGNSIAGGLIGSVLSAATIDSSFSSSNVRADHRAGALLGDAGSASVSVKDSYACGIVHTENRLTYGALAGAGAPSYDNVRYLSQSGNPDVEDAYDSAGAPPPEGVLACEYDLLAQGVSNPIARCHPYEPALRGKAYPFPMVTRDYYGDWPLRIEPEDTEPVNGDAYGLSYYEEYTDGSWGFYSFDADGNLLDSLDYSNTKTILRAGYAVAVSAGKTNVQPPSIGEWRYVTLGTPIRLSDRDIDIYPITNAERLSTHVNQKDVQITDNETNRLFYFNPFFGATLSLDKILANAETPVHIRTEKQLATRNRISDDWYFKQTHDIRVTGASFSVAGQTVSAGSFHNNTSGAVYDGGGNTIYDLKKPLFITNNDGAVIKNLTLEDFSIVNSPQSPVGALAETNNTGGLITNCHVRLGEVSSQSGNVAGLVGKNLGTITTSSVKGVTVSAGSGDAAGFTSHSQGTIADSRVENLTITSESGDAAGFILSNAGATTGSHVEGVMISAENGNASGFADTIQWENGRIINCTASGSVSAKGAGEYAAGFVRVIQGASCYIENCNALDMKVRAPNGDASGFVDLLQWGGNVLYCTASNDISGGQTHTFIRNLVEGTIVPPPSP